MPSNAIWFFGADAAGKSVVGWEAYSQLVARGLPAAYVDTDYLGFCDPRPNDPSALVAANLAAIWHNYAKQGIRYVVVSGILVTPEHRSLFAAALTNCSLSTVLLQARPHTIRARILRRREVEATEQQTQLTDSVLRELHDYGERSARFAALLEAGGFADLTIHTDTATPEQIAAEALDRLLSPEVQSAASRISVGHCVAPADDRLLRASPRRVQLRKSGLLHDPPVGLEGMCWTARGR